MSGGRSYTTSAPAKSIPVARRSMLLGKITLFEAKFWGDVTEGHFSCVWHHSVPTSGLSRNFGGLLDKKDNLSRLPASVQVGRAR